LGLAANNSPAMESLQQKCRPKHQVLVLKCYPRTIKGAVDVKPNSSELSYLLFYALSRRSKIAKIGSFLEQKTAKDVWRLRIGWVKPGGGEGDSACRGARARVRSCFR
jgi:hypothetical protein